ncbi:Signal transduction histidine kinase [Agromyces sp. CF514]|uniref:sensor histidine kinase n=1 Tax=Agromyces sp. CF514 TaxID=1881031 RepID=UPI0008F1C0F0|nr:histidine kinase [Agromyces sp. CF514]SFR78754.1 Signal transduction histidine kinase [Agromyces sp. CF514]
MPEYRISRAKLTTDIVLAVVFGLMSLPFALMGNGADLAAMVLFVTALAVRRLAPAWALGIAWAAATVQMAALRDLQFYDFAVLGVLYSTAAHGGRLVKWLGLVSAGAGALIATLYLQVVMPVFDGVGGLGPENLFAAAFIFVASVAVLVLAWTAGLLARSVRDGREVRRREEVANRERALAEYRYTVEQERNRIARDMHDVVAHSLAVVIAQADGARFAARTRPDAASEALSTISGVARGALGDVRVLLAELRHREGGAPQPVLDDLGGLIAGVVDAGLDVRLVETGERRELGTGHQIAVYRIVQEALTNALRHGDTTAPVDVRLDWADDGIGLAISNRIMADAAGSAAASGAGLAGAATTATRHGITGMRERAQLVGGALTAEPGSDGVFRVVARIPAQPRTPEPRSTP